MCWKWSEFCSSLSRTEEQWGGGGSPAGWACQLSGASLVINVLIRAACNYTKMDKNKQKYNINQVLKCSCKSVKTKILLSPNVCSNNTFTFIIYNYYYETHGTLPVTSPLLSVELISHKVKTNKLGVRMIPFTSQAKKLTRSTARSRNLGTHM